jgi:hypothetical protein
VEVQDNVARFGSVDGDLGGPDAAQCGRGHGHIDVGGKADCDRIALRFSRRSVLTAGLDMAGNFVIAKRG